MASSSSSNKVLLVSSDGENFEVEESVILLSQTIKNIIEEDDCAKSAIPLPNVTSRILAKVIEYCKRHSEESTLASEEGFGFAAADGINPPESNKLKQFDSEFVNVDHDTLFDLILAANYLHIKELLDMTCQAVADMMKGKQPEEIRKIFNIKNDYTKEEEDEVRKENAWAFEDV